jgi:ferredoxin-thioredoxin reductase catalytic subunit
MIKEKVINKKEINKLYDKLKKQAESSGYNLNPDIDFTKELIKGLIINEKRYGYPCCPCRLSEGEKSKDIDIICPCDYRDSDLDEYDTCYCSLYVTKKIIEGKKELTSIPERRSTNIGKNLDKEKDRKLINLSKPIWRCKVCGYLCARDNPPEICPICKAKKERFEKFIT